MRQAGITEASDKLAQGTQLFRTKNQSWPKWRKARGYNKIFRLK